MADDKKNSPNPASANDPKSVKRPYATLDLKATEIKVTSISEKSSKDIAAEAARLAASAIAGRPIEAKDVPLPLAASAYAAAVSAGVSANASRADSNAQGKAGAAQQATQKPAAKTEAASAASVASTATAAASDGPRPNPAARPASPFAHETVVVKKRGGFLSHLAAGLIGGILAISASEWALPQLGLHGSTSRIADDTASLERRLASVEKKQAAPAGGVDLAAIEQRLAAVETTAKQVPYLAEAQSHLVAETKAALASAASDSGAPQFIERLVKVEGQLKSLSDAGANDPNAGRLEQLAALTGKVADLETSLETKLTELRKSVSDDVSVRLTSALETSEAAKSGTVRIDKDVASVKSEAARIAERIEAMKLDNDRLSEALRLAREDQVALKAALETMKTEVAKPADIAAAVGPVTEKVATLEKSLANVVKAEDDRRSNAERVLLSLELQNLKRVIERGQKYAVELADVQKIAAGKVDLSALDKFKDQGVPPLADLNKDFREAANKAIDAEAEPVEGGVVDRLIAGAKSVVRVRKVSHDSTDKSAEAVVGRMELALNEGRLGDVLTAAKELSPKAAEAAQPFLDKVAARAGVDTAVAALEAQLKTSLNNGTTGADAAPKATQ